MALLDHYLCIALTHVDQHSSGQINGLKIYKHIQKNDVDVGDAGPLFQSRNNCLDNDVMSNPLSSSELSGGDVGDATPKQPKGTRFPSGFEVGVGLQKETFRRDVQEPCDYLRAEHNLLLLNDGGARKSIGPRVANQGEVSIEPAYLFLINNHPFAEEIPPALCLEHVVNLAEPVFDEEPRSNE